jgi:polyisoprenoid-binding protein YceI
MRSSLFFLILTITTANLVFAQFLTPIDETSRVEFKIKNFGSVVNGSFKGLQGKIQFDPSAPAAAVFDVTVDTNTIDTGIGMRDNHLRKPEYFHVKSYPRIRFVSTKISTSGKPGEFIMTGNLIIKNTTREISFPFSYSGTGLFKGQFQIDRRNYAVGGNSISLADNLTVYLNVMTKR